MYNLLMDMFELFVLMPWIVLDELMFDHYYEMMMVMLTLNSYYYFDLLWMMMVL